MHPKKFKSIGREKSIYLTKMADLVQVAQPNPTTAFQTLVESLLCSFSKKLLTVICVFPPTASTIKAHKGHRQFLANKLFLKQAIILRFDSAEKMP